MADSITCPRCTMTSYNPNDVAQGYCGKCQDWTGEAAAAVQMDVILSGIAFDVHARRAGDNYQGFVYLGANVVFELVEPKSKTPAGLEDFANVTMRTFARKLATLLGQGGHGFRRGACDGCGCYGEVGEVPDPRKPAKTLWVCSTCVKQL